MVVRGKPKAELTLEKLEHHILNDSVLLTDGLQYYKDIVAIKACTHYPLTSYKENNNLLHLNTVNNTYGIFKRMTSQ